MKQEWWSGQTRFGVTPGLDRIAALLGRLGQPHDGYPTVHVAGTNGKGSVSAMVARALKSQGLRVGLYVSPDMGRLNERVMIDGSPLPESVWDALAFEIEEAGVGLEPMPTWFETVTALGFLAFNRCQVDVAVVEVGLGGRLDATNVIKAPLLSIITPVAMDHTHYLGHTIRAIAGEKAGILKRGTELVLARQPFDEARAVILGEAERLSVPVYEPSVTAKATMQGAQLSTTKGLLVRVPLLGAYQADNLATAWTAVERLAQVGVVERLEDAGRALEDVHWPGRFQIVSLRPLVVVDGAHNPHGVAAVVKTLTQPPWNQRSWHVVFGVLSDKAGEEMAALLAKSAAAMTLTRVPGERGRTPESLVASISSSVAVDVEDDPLTAVRRAAQGDHAVLVTGSLALLAHLRTSGLISPDQSVSIVDG